MDPLIRTHNPLPMDPSASRVTKAAISRPSLDSIPTSFATASLGASSDSLEAKLAAIESAGFQAIELAFMDLVSFASAQFGKEITEDDFCSLCKAGEEVRKLCAKHNLQIMMLQPLTRFEGWEIGTSNREVAFTRAEGWIRIMQSLGTDMLQLGSSDAAGISTDTEKIVCDLRELADMLSKQQFRLAYENWAWSTHAPTWKDVWNIVKAVDRPNVGLCLDTFQIAGSEYGDPTTTHGLIPDQGFQHKLEMNFKSTLVTLALEVPAEKIYALEISDAYKPPTPLEAKVVDGCAPRARWSKSFRPYPFNGGYLPVAQVAKAVLSTGFRGWFCTEVFDGGLDGHDFVKKEDFGNFAKGAMESHRRLLDECADT